MIADYITLRAEYPLVGGDFEDFTVFKSLLTSLVEAARRCCDHWTVDIPFTLTGEKNLVCVEGSIFFSDYNVGDEDGEVVIDRVHYKLRKQIVGDVAGTALDVFLHIQGLYQSIFD